MYFPPARVVHEAEHWEESTTACLSKHDCVRLQQTCVSVIKLCCLKSDKYLSSSFLAPLGALIGLDF